VITSLKNRKVAQAVRLKKRAFRERENRFLVEGAQPVGEALESAVPLDLVFHTDRERLQPILARARESGVDVQAVTEEIMARLTSTVTPQGVVAVSPFVDVGLEELPRAPGSLAVLFAVRDPGNAGTVLRSADAAGADGVVFCQGSVDVYNPKTVRASAGSVFHVPVVRGASVEESVAAARDRGVAVYAASGRGDVDLYSLDLRAPSAFLFGNEAWGLPDEVAALADRTVRVPLWGKAESLNLAAAATVALFESARQRRVALGPSLEALIAGAAHDIRSPLTAVKGFASTLARKWGEVGDEQRELMLEAIQYDAERLNLTIKQLLDAARLAAGRIELAKDHVDVGQLVSEVGAFLERGEAYPDIRWAGGTVIATTDRERLRAMIGSMVEAVAWWAQEGPIEIAAESEHSELTITVSRAGTTLTSADAAGLFGPREPGSGGGSKIGLFVARGVAEARGGSATAEANDGWLRLRLVIPPGP
jgi:TrmH family RNA methyltransferase